MHPQLYGSVCSHMCWCLLPREGTGAGNTLESKILPIYLQVPLPHAEPQDALPQPAQEGRHSAVL